MNETIKILADLIVASTAIKYIHVNGQFNDLYFEFDDELLHFKSAHFQQILTSEVFTFAKTSFAEKLSNPVEFVNSEHIATHELPKELKLKAKMFALAVEQI